MANRYGQPKHPGNPTAGPAAPGDHFSTQVFRGFVRLLFAIIVVGALTIGATFIAAAWLQNATAISASQRTFDSFVQWQQRDLARLARDYAFWNDALTHLVRHPDVVWADENIGEYLFDAFDINFAAVMTGKNELSVAFRNGELLAPDKWPQFGRELESLLKTARAGTELINPESAAGMLRLDGSIHLAAICRIGPESQDVAPSPDPAAVLILLRTFPGTDAQQLQDFGFRGLRLISQEEARDSAAHPLLTADGVLLAIATWNPSLPGGLLVAWLLPAIVLVFGAMAGLLYLLFRRARNVAAAIAADGSLLAAQHSALEQSETRYRMLFDEMLDGCALHEIVTDAAGKAVDYRYLAVNPAWERMTCLSRVEVIGRSSLDVLPEADPNLVERFGLVALSGVPQKFESFSRALGRFFDVRAYRTEPGRFAVIFQDVTQHKLAETALRESLSRFRQIFQHHDAAMLLIDPQAGTIVDANSAAARFYGYDVEVLVGSPISLLNTLPSEEVKLQLQKAAREERSRIIFPQRLASGALATVEVNTLLIVNQGRSVLFSIIHDITPR